MEAPHTTHPVRTGRSSELQSSLFVVFMEQ